MEHFADKEPEYFLKGIELLVHRCEVCHLKKWVRPETFGPYHVRVAVCMYFH
jgi:hypothetical protein